MPRVKALNHFPDRYAEIVRECALEGKRVELAPMPTFRALSLRGHWYAWVASLKAEAAKRRKEIEPRSDDLAIFEIENLQPTVMVEIQDVGDGQAKLVFQSREHSWQAAALRTAIVTQTDSKPSSASLDSDAARLLNIQKEVDRDGNG
jgi:hypothetical protein